MTQQSQTTSSSSDDDNPFSPPLEEEEDSQHEAHAGSTEAGMVRGVSRSVAQRTMAARTAGRAVAKLPQVGRLPKPAPRVPPIRAAARGVRVPKPAVPRKVPVPKARVPKASVPRKVPVRQVARYTDRMSQGLDVWGAYEEGPSNQKLKRRQQLARLGTFAASLVKNTILGAIVFETYCWGVAESETIFTKNNPSSKSSSSNEEHVHTPIYNKDVFETTPLAVHFGAGAAGGSLQGLGGILWDATAETLSRRKLTLPKDPVLRHTFQHAAAHSILFGSYESCKRLIVGNLHYLGSDWNSNYSTHRPELLHQERVEYFLGIALAGGWAGQFQHVASHVLEQTSWPKRLPTLSSTLWAFPPSAIAFLAFEYGKEQVVALSSSSDDDD